MTYCIDQLIYHTTKKSRGRGARIIVTQISRPLNRAEALHGLDLEVNKHSNVDQKLYRTKIFQKVINKDFISHDTFFMFITLQL